MTIEDIQAAETRQLRIHKTAITIVELLDSIEAEIDSDARDRVLEMVNDE